VLLFWRTATKPEPGRNADHAETAGMREAKGEVARLLDEKLANDHYVLNDLHLLVGREKCWIDHLVVAPSGMFVINTLNWDGRIVGDTGKQTRFWKIRTPDGKIRQARNPIGRALRERRILCNWLKGTNLIWERVFPLVAWPIRTRRSRSPTPNAASDAAQASSTSTTSASRSRFCQTRSRKARNGLNRHTAEA
jgi:hypothetical protein